ncbi:MAG: hypothetical protein NTX49_10270 [Chlamydiae bacterium]|nr:hypothetical protein [Chlamydiota bacterium]
MLARAIPGEEIKFWFARDLQDSLGYFRLENFRTAITRAIESCMRLQETYYKLERRIKSEEKKLVTQSG